MTNQELLKVYSSYLPYRVKAVIGNVRCNIAYLSSKRIAIIRKDGMGEIEKYKWEYLQESRIKLLLRPLSDLCQKIEVEGEETTWLEHLLNKNPRYFNYLTYKPMFNNYWEFEALVKNHFDVFGLLDKNLAINLNEVK